MGERVTVSLACTVCQARNYRTTRSRAREKVLELKKFCRHCGKHTVHRETK